MRTRLYIIAALILLAGLGSAALIYLTAGSEPDGVLGYEVIDGIAYPIKPDDSRMYAHDLELYGGKAMVLADEFRRWFIGLWHGKSLAYTVACIAFFSSLVVIIIANNLESREPEDGDNNSPSGNGSFV